MLAAVSWSDVWQVVGLIAVVAIGVLLVLVLLQVLGIHQFGQPVATVRKPKSTLDRNLVYVQWWIAVGLIVFGAAILIAYHYAGIFSIESGTTGAGGSSSGGSDSTANLVTYVATAIIGAGIATLPTTSGGAASARVSGATASAAVIGPIVRTGAIKKTDSGISFTGEIDTAGVDTMYFFEYRDDKASDYTDTTAIKKLSASQAGKFVRVESDAVTGVANDWHYRLVAVQPTGAPVRGDDMTVTGA